VADHEQRIDKIDAASGRVVGSIPAPGGGRDSGLTWAEGSLWVGQYRDRRIHQIDPATGAVLRTIESDRFVTGVTWVDGELWHGTWEGDESELRHIDPADGPCSNGFRCPRAPASAARVRRRRPVLLRRRRERQGARGAPSEGDGLTTHSAGQRPNRSTQGAHHEHDHDARNGAHHPIVSREDWLVQRRALLEPKRP